jgi:hypothetical protein
LWRFLYTYFLKRGFLDGYPGFLISTYMAVYEFEIGMKMYELRKTGWPTLVGATDSRPQESPR